jgi:hypothetical protein
VLQLLLLLLLWTLLLLLMLLAVYECGSIEEPGERWA